MVDIFNFSELPMEKQIAIGMLLPFLPVIIGETLFFYLIIFAGMDILMSFSVSLSFTAFGLTLWYMWRDKVRREIMEFEPINAILRWSKEVVTWENQMVISRISLKNENGLRPTEVENVENVEGGVKSTVSIPKFNNPPTYKKEVLYYSQKAQGYIRQVIDVPFKPSIIKIGINEYVIGNPVIVESLLSGKKIAEVELHHNSVAPNGIPYRRIQFIHNFPYQDDFHMCPEQFVVHQAQVLAGSSSVIDAVFLYWSERGEPIPVFLVLSSPAIADMVQQSIGMKPVLKDSDDKEGGRELRMEIEDAVKLGDATQTINTAQLLRARTTTLQVLSDSMKDVEDQALGLWSAWEQQEKEIESPMKSVLDLSDWRVLAILVFAVVTSAVVIWWVWFK